MRRAAALLALLLVPLLTTCAGPSVARRAFPMDVKRPESCPSPEVTANDYVELTVVSASHMEYHQLNASCDDKHTPGCTLAQCRAPHQRQWCLGPRVYRQLYPHAMGAGLPRKGERFVVMPLCNDGDSACEAQIGLTVVNTDGSIARYGWCRLLGGQIHMEDSAQGARGDFDDLVMDCEVKSKRGSGSRPCFPLY